MSHLASSDDFDHQRSRLGILAILTEASSSQFRFLSETLQLTDRNLSNHLGALEAASLVKVGARYQCKRRRTSVLITRTGRKAFAAEISALRRLVDQAGDDEAQPGSAPRHIEEPDHD